MVQATKQQQWKHQRGGDESDEDSSMDEEVKHVDPPLAPPRAVVAHSVAATVAEAAAAAAAATAALPNPTATATTAVARQPPAPPTPAEAPTAADPAPPPPAATATPTKRGCATPCSAPQLKASHWRHLEGEERAGWETAT